MSIEAMKHSTSMNGRSHRSNAAWHQTQVVIGGADPSALDQRIRAVYECTGSFRPARLSPFAQFDVVLNVGWTPAGENICNLYRIPDGWSSLHLLGLNLPGWTQLPVSPIWSLGGGTKRLRKLHIAGMAGCFNMRIPPWSCLAVLGVSGRHIPDEPCDPRRHLLADIAPVAQEVATIADLDTALDRFEAGLASRLDGVYESLPLRVHNQIETMTRAAAIAAGSRGELGVAAIAEEMGLSVSHLRRVFNANAPIALGTYLDTLRFWHAVELINDPDRTHDLTVIAQMAGFADSSHMVRQFRRHVGMTPSMFRRELGHRVLIRGGIMAVVDLPIEAEVEPSPFTCEATSLA
ncbi:MAG: helix-turn-helix domain-containing protein [Planctomycetota bacterium]